MSSNKKGFTLIELLIVVVIIGILAAIAIPKFANTKDKAYVAAMKSDLRNLATYEEQYAAETTARTSRVTVRFRASRLRRTLPCWRPQLSARRPRGPRPLRMLFQRRSAIQV